MTFGGSMGSRMIWNGIELPEKNKDFKDERD